MVDKIILQGDFSNIILHASDFADKKYEGFKERFGQLPEFISESCSRHFKEVPITKGNTVIFTFVNENAVAHAYAYCICELQYIEQQDWK